MNIRSGLRIGAAAALIGLFPLASLAQEDHDHHGDIEVEVEGGQLAVHAHETDALGYAFFEASFYEAGESPAWEISSPGFAGEGLQPGSLIGFTGVANLSFWNGSAWSGAGAATLAIEDALDALTVFSASGVANPSGYVGEAHDDGDLHSHLHFILSEGAAAGAYSVMLQLFSATSVSDDTPVYAASSPFSLIFNAGLSHAAFEDAVAAHVAPVPLPAGLWLLLSGLMGTGVVLRRRGRVAGSPAMT